MQHLRLRALREDNDWSQAQMARLLSISQATYSDYERGKLNIPIITLVHLANFYHTSIDYLLGLTDQPRPYPNAKSRP